MIERGVLVGVVLLVACKGVTDSGGNPPSTTNPQTTSVLTQHNDNTRAGWNANETALTTSNVNVQHFGKLFSLAVDDQVFAQPLVAGGITIRGGVHNVVYVATVDNTLYAFDGDNGTLYWQRNFTAPGMRPPTNTDMTGACGGTYSDVSHNIGIIGTPVIDGAKRTIYFVARSTNNGTFVQHLHAVDLVSGNEVAGSPVAITASTNGSGDGSVNNVLSFDAQRENQRQALTLLDGVVYVTFASHCDWGPYHGWILGYDAATLQQQVVYNATPDGSDGGMWESGNGMAADALGNLYVVVGNGTVGSGGDPTNVRNRGESALKLTRSGGTLQVASYFTPANYQSLNDNDLDYGGAGAFLIPNSSFFLTGGKDGNLFLLNKDDMGGYQSSGNVVHQVLSLGSASVELHCQPAYYKGATKELVYVWSENDALRAIPFDRGSNMLDPNGQVVLNSFGPTGQSGAVLSVSSNGSVDGTGIVWASHPYAGDAGHNVVPGILRAFDANDVTKELWNNRQTAPDAAGNFAKFAPPTIANGHVYLPTFSNQVVVYGLR